MEKIYWTTMLSSHFFLAAFNIEVEGRNYSADYFSNRGHAVA
jgi:hypothetical protein